MSDSPADSTPVLQVLQNAQSEFEPKMIGCAFLYNDEGAFLLSLVAS
jgi:hypothetical protein